MDSFDLRAVQMGNWSIRRICTLLNIFRFKEELRQIAASLGDITSATKQVMERASILLGFQETSKKSTEKTPRDNPAVKEENDSRIVSYKLLPADQVCTQLWIINSR